MLRPGTRQPREDIGLHCIHPRGIEHCRGECPMECPLWTPEDDADEQDRREQERADREDAGEHPYGLPDDL